MAWYAILRSDGSMASITSVVPDTLPVGLEVFALPRNFDWGTETWDPTTRTIVPKPPTPDLTVDRVNDFIARATFLDSRLTATQRTQFRTILATFLGKQRFRDSSESVDL